MRNYQLTEWHRMVGCAEKSLRSQCPLLEDEVLVAANNEIEKLKQQSSKLKKQIANLKQWKEDALAGYGDNLEDWIDELEYERNRLNNNNELHK